jgi:AsmA protein
MKAKLIKVILVIAGSVAALVLAAVIFTLTFNLNQYRPRIEAAASKATGMQVRINGKISPILFPHAGVSLENVLIQNRGEEIVSLKKAEAGISLLSFLRRKALIRQIELMTPTLFITKNSRGRFNFLCRLSKASGIGHGRTMLYFKQSYLAVELY